MALCRLNNRLVHQLIHFGIKREGWQWKAPDALGGAWNVQPDHVLAVLGINAET